MRRDAHIDEQDEHEGQIDHQADQERRHQMAGSIDRRHGARDAACRFRRVLHIRRQDAREHAHLHLRADAIGHLLLNAVAQDATDEIQREDQHDADGQRPQRFISLVRDDAVVNRHAEHRQGEHENVRHDGNQNDLEQLRRLERRLHDAEEIDMQAIL